MTTDKPTTKIPLVPMDGGLLTSYVRGTGGTRLHGKIPPPERLTTVKQTGATAFRLAPMAAATYAELDRDVRERGGARLRCTDAFRDPKVQGQARKRYDNWVHAGRPEPGTRGWDSRSMKSAYVAKPGESHHGWGGAVDLDVEALEFPNVRRGSDEALWTFWSIAEEHGWTPIISAPVMGQSECWHFEHLGPLRAVGRLFTTHAYENNRYRRPYSLVATVGCLLTQTMPPSTPRLTMRYIQARLLIHGAWCGEPDGHLGTKTIAALGEVGIPNIRRSSSESLILAAINEARIGCAAMEEA